MDIKLMNTDLAQKVNEYFDRTGIKLYSRNKEGLWRIVGGKISSDVRGVDPGRLEVDGVYQGRFVDVVAVAVQQRNFYGDYCSNVNNMHNGYVEPVEMKKVPKYMKVD